MKDEGLSKCEFCLAEFSEGEYRVRDCSGGRAEAKSPTRGLRGAPHKQ